VSPVALLAGQPAKRWLVTGAAGFIGSHLVETLLAGGQSVTGFDNLSTGYRRNLDDVRAVVGEAAWSRFEFIEADLTDAAACVRRFVYASSSSVYGDHPALPKVEDQTGRPLSPYAATKAIDELLAGVYAHTYGIECVGLRYFNVFGPRQDPDGAYAAVIPKWTASILKGESVWINGDGETSRDFCYVANAVQANLRAALAPTLPSGHEVFNVAAGRRTTLLELFGEIRARLSQLLGTQLVAEPGFRDFRAGDVRHSLADVSKAARLLGYAPTHDVNAGLEAAMAWYVAFIRATAPGSQAR
jgi:UDP-N-acetylglucosamine 4-epimerase